jgi:putative Mg2+ transporter-C (MgtC) family protein
MVTGWHARHFISFEGSDAMEDEEIRSMLESQGLPIANISYRVSDNGADFEYRMVIRTSSPAWLSTLAR